MSRRIGKRVLAAIRDGEVTECEEHENRLIGGPVFRVDGRDVEVHMGCVWVEGHIVCGTRWASKVERALLDAGLWDSRSEFERYDAELKERGN